MTTDHDEHDLRALLADAVDDVEPADRIAELRRRVATRPRRTRLYAGGAVLAAAAAVTAVAVVAARPAPVEPAPADPPTVEEHRVATYHLGDTGRGTRLFAEWDEVAAADPLAAVLEELQSTPDDPDYRTPWAGAFEGVLADGATVVVALAPEAPLRRPDDLAPDEAALALQQVVHSLGAVGGAVAPVRFELDGTPVDRLLGVRLEGAEVPPVPPEEVLALVNLEEPAERATVSGSFTARGLANSNEANVLWRLERDGDVVADGFATAEGWMDRLYPWQVEVDVSGLDPGEYTLVASTDDPSGGEGFPPDVDTRTVVVE